MPTPSHPPLSWPRLFTQAVLAAFAYAFMEWLFFATKASFMDALPLGKKLEIFLLTGLALTALAVLPLSALRVLGWIPGPTKRWQVFTILGAAVPALILAALSLLLIDNFTYTLIKIGIVTSVGLWRGAYGLLALIMLALWTRALLRDMKDRPSAWRRAQTRLAVGLTAAGLGLALLRVGSAAGPAAGENASLLRRPHIVLLGGDGTVAANMSLYGYARDTTPNLRRLAETGLLAENHFTNAAHSTGSVASMLTGKYPTETRLLYSPNILQGENAVQHLPGILQRAGYRTIEITMPYYLDAYTINMQEAFDEVNGRSVGQGELFRLARRYNLEDAGYFLPRLGERILDRVLHIFYVQVMPDPYRQVMQTLDPNTLHKMSDQERILELVRQLKQAEGPLFAHVHLMDTHGPKFYPRRQVFSARQSQDRDWMQDFFDDAVLDYDAYVGQLLDALSHAGLLDQTVIVVYSDHVNNWRTDGRIPLLFRFPNGEHSGRIRSSTQNLDVAPTLLDYLGLETPVWMSGASLLAGEPDRARPIFSAGVVGVQCRPPDWWCVVDPNLVRAPFYQFGYIQVTICQRMYTLELNHDRMSEVDVSGHTAPCEPAVLPARAEVRELILDHFEANGFDVSTLR